MAFATDEEIKMAHEVLLKGKDPFDEKRVDIIKNDSSCYVQASPGSGKTTALLAKLVILANIPGGFPEFFGTQGIKTSSPLGHMAGLAMNCLGDR